MNKLDDITNKQIKANRCLYHKSLISKYNRRQPDKNPAISHRSSLFIIPLFFHVAQRHKSLLKLFESCENHYRDND